MKIGIIVAMDKEFRQLKTLLDDSTAERVNATDFVCGKMGANEVILQQCGIGKVNSAIGAVEMINRFSPDLVVSSGVAGGADIILLPEIPYDLDCVLAAIERRHKEGKRFSILAVAEGAMSKEDALLGKKEYNKKKSESPYPSVSYELGARIEKEIGREVRITVPGHTQRGGSPDPYDRFISSRLGATAGRLVVERQYGRMVAFDGFDVVTVPLSTVAGKLKYVDPKCAAIREAKDMGICFGDE